MHHRFSLERDGFASLVRRVAFGSLAAGMALASVGLVRPAHAATAPAASVASRAVALLARPVPQTGVITPAADVSVKIPVDVASIAKDERGVGGIAFGPFADGGTDAVVIGSGSGAVPFIRVVATDGTSIRTFSAFPETAYRADTRVAVGDVDGDGQADIVAATGAGPSGRVRVFSAEGTPRSDGWLPYAGAFHGGVAIAVADFNGDGKAEIATIPSSGGGPHIRIWNGDGELLGEFSAFLNDEPGMFDIAAGTLDGGKRASLAVVRSDQQNAVVRVYAPDIGALIREFALGNDGTRVTLAIGDATGDGAGNILVLAAGKGPVASAPGQGATLNVRSLTGAWLGASIVADMQMLGRATVSGSGRVAVAAFALGAAKNDAAKYIEVDLSEQRLRAYEHGEQVKTFLVTTGMKGYDTPQGNFSIQAKPYKVYYKWSYGPGHPENYDLGWVTWNLRFYPHIYIHYAPWRSVFGRVGSHGCVNVSKKDAQWIYDWAEVGTPITIQS